MPSPTSSFTPSPFTLQFTGKYTFFGKTASLLNTGNELGHMQKILLTIMAVLVGISFLLCGTCFGYLMVRRRVCLQQHTLTFPRTPVAAQTCTQAHASCRLQ